MADTAHFQSRLRRREEPMGLIPNFYELKETAEESIELLRRAVAALEKLAAEQKRTNDLYAEVNQVSVVHARNSTEL
ncbi:hypothetical protein MFM001_45830 [Mycobacterium sp. MFM001]|nr:hypothetical protein MFM001_45830 [Mycobacterium sp. MFM001]